MEQKIIQDRVYECTSTPHLTMCIIRDSERIGTSTSRIFQQIPGNWIHNNKAKAPMSGHKINAQYCVNVLVYSSLAVVCPLTHHRWKTLADVCWCQESRGHQSSAHWPTHCSLFCHGISLKPFSKLLETSTLKVKYRGCIMKEII